MDLTTLELKRRQVALEAFAVTDVTGLLARIYPAITEVFSGFAGKFHSDNPYVELTGKQQDFMRELQKHAYMDIRMLTAYVPEGLTSGYAEYSKTLLAASQHASGILTKTLSPYSTFLGSLVTNAGERTATHMSSREYAEMQKRREGLAADMAKCFQPGSTKTDSTVGAVVTRNADWVDVFKQADSITSFITSVDRKLLNRKVDECVKIVNTLQELIKRDQFGKVSPEVVKNLAEGAYQIASELEFYALVYYRVIVLNTCLNSTIEYLQKTLKA